MRKTKNQIPPLPDVGQQLVEWKPLWGKDLSYQSPDKLNAGRHSSHWKCKWKLSQHKSSSPITEKTTTEFTAGNFSHDCRPKLSNREKHCFELSWTCMQVALKNITYPSNLQWGSHQLLRIYYGGFMWSSDVSLKFQLASGRIPALMPKLGKRV